MSKLHEICERRDLKEVASLLSSKVKTPLYVPSKYGDLSSVKVTSRIECNFKILVVQGNIHHFT